METRRERDLGRLEEFKKKKNIKKSRFNKLPHNIIYILGTEDYFPSVLHKLEMSKPIIILGF